MKKYIYILMVGLAALAVSCKKEHVNPYADAEKGSSAIKIVKSQLEYTPVASTGIVEVEAEGTVTAKSDRDWCTASVSGKQITLSLTANTDKETRYAQLKITAGQYSTALSVFQYGEVVAGLDVLTDVTASVEGKEIRIPIKANVTIEFDPTESWIHPSATQSELVVTVDPNPDPMTRFGTVSYTAGSRQGSFEVTQLPELKKNADWVLSLTESTYDYPKYLANTSVTAGDADMYVITSLPKSKVEENNLPDYIFSELAVKIRRDILDQVEANPETSFTDYLLKGSTTPVVEDISLGDSYLIAIGFADNGYVSGQYQYTAITIEDIRPVFYRWTGKWKVHRKNSKNDVDDIWVISVKEKDTKLMIQGIEGLSDEDGRFDVEATVDEDGHLVLKTQNTLTYKDPTYGDVTVLLSGQYDDTAAGKTYFTSKTGVSLLSATLSDDFNSATMEGSVASGTYCFKNIQFYGRYKKSGSSSWSTISWSNAGTTDIAQTITRVE